MPTARTVPELLEYHGRSVVALRVLDSSVDTLAGSDRDLFPRRREGVIETLEEMRNELDAEVVLAIVASAERVIRLDFRARLGGKDPAGVRFGLLDTRLGGRVPLEEIVDVWKDLVQASDECGAFKQMYNYRHGLAHGRYFNKSGRDDVAPKDAADVVDGLFAKISVFTTDFPRF